MEYRGRHPIFDTSRIRSYPLAARPSRVGPEALIAPDIILSQAGAIEFPGLNAIVGAILRARAEGRSVILMTGAHLVKNGFGLLLRDLMARRLITLLAVNAAGFIHDLEFALTGRTSEDVPQALPRGEFGFAEETCALMNGALTHGERLKIGAGEAMGRLISGEPFPEAVRFLHPEWSIAAGGLQFDVPVTMHAMIGTDIIDQHPSWDAAAKGGCSGRDFLIFAEEVSRLAGGVYLNIGTSVIGPEVFLKACSMAANVGRPPTGLTTASFDLRPAHPEDVNDERKSGYYFRDVKSVVVRVPQAFGGHGHYIRGDHSETLPALYRALVLGSA